MSTEHSEVFTKENLDLYLRELSKEYKRLGGKKVSVEITLIGVLPLLKTMASGI